MAGALTAAVALAVVPVVIAVNRSAERTAADTATPDPVDALLPNGHRLTPAGTSVTLGNLPMGGAVTADGRYLWTVSAGFDSNDIRIVDTTTNAVCQIVELPGASGGITLDSVHRLAYVSGLPNSRWQPTKNDLPGAQGDDVLVYSWGDTCGQASLDRVIKVPPQPGAPAVQVFPPPRAGEPATVAAWPQKLAVSPDGSRLLVALNLANSAAVIDLTGGDQVSYVDTGSYPFGAAITPDGTLGLVSNEAAGTVSVIDLATATKLTDVTVGAPLSHPQGIVVDAEGERAFVALSASDQVVVLDLADREVERTLSVGRPEGLGTMPVAVTLNQTGDRLYVAESGADEIAVFTVPDEDTAAEAGASAPATASDDESTAATSDDETATTTADADGDGDDAATATTETVAAGGTGWTMVGRIPTSQQPQAVLTTSAADGQPARLLYVTAEGVGIGPNPKGTNPANAADPIFWAFNPKPPSTDVFDGYAYPPRMVTGQAGILPLPTDAQVAASTAAASAQQLPTNTQAAPKDTVLRADGPIKHVFFVVRENRSYDQLLGDDTRGNGDPKLTVFGQGTTPNMHALVQQFPLLDNVYANSEASIQGHYWTAASIVPDYVTRNWVQQYGGRGRPNDFGSFVVDNPPNGFLFNQAERQGISYFNYGEAFIGGFTSVPDRDRSPQALAELTKVEANSDLGPTTNGCYPGDMSIGTAMDGGEIFDSSMPAGAPQGAYSHYDCFAQRFAQQLATDSVPALSYLSMPSDHTRGTQPGFPTPTAMQADADLGLGQLVQLISSSDIWSSSAIFVVEDDSQDGADHVNAHRIPALVVSPYTKQGAVLHTRYDLVSVVRSIELIIGMDPLSLNDATATPMYDVFTSTPENLAPYTARPATVDLLTMNDAASPDSEWSASLALDQVDRVPQRVLDAILWHSVYGSDSNPPPPGPDAEGEEAGEAD
ncbi:bifunctional YncE family protein/alkaline phosphatase family protein [Cellulomonas citrea]|uniref:bifunctional YncE family protein/alkaline phosphatase family protein n=1 Tax=Cellulomonas citrea TaxID=1909423 RepID=UPI001359B645|nr:alkaline phosphatase family protein [Cellulomonas citrea]